MARERPTEKERERERAIERASADACLERDLGKRSC
jgi:hypothetical protein